MKKHDSEVISTTSSTSKGSDRRKNRFSLRRIFNTTGTTGRTKSRISLNSNSSAQSDYGFLAPPSGRGSPPGATAAPLSAASQPGSLRVPSTTPAQLKRSDSGTQQECPLCLTEWPVENFPDVSTCDHRSCLSCLQMYLKIEITESRINIACPECSEKFHPNDIKFILQDEVLMQKYEDFMVRRVLVADPDARWCPAPDCGYAVIAKECAGCPKIKCERPGCDTFFCYHCKQYWHPNKTCDTARAERALNDRSGSVTYSHDAESQKDYIKPCPRCSAFIMKMNDGSCNHMTCPVCGAEFCWLCMKEISDLHYLSPSGCTFWGKKPWSRKKKILWQLGTLIGAPVGITLVAGVAVPAMIIGIPVWVGRKIHSKYETASRRKRNLAIVGGVAASVLVAPVVAGLAVGIGVPILLGYVYGVVPISLCRSGGCGITTTDGGGVRFEFEENETGIPSGMYPSTDTQSVGTGHHVANPSIAPSIGEASVGMTNSIYSASGSNMDRVGIIPESDRDSVSNRAIAGASLNGSMSGSTYAAVIGLHTKLEVQAEMSGNHNKRASFSSESASANFSIGEKSIGEKSVLADDCSTKALAGSIVNYKLDAGSSASEVQIDVFSNHSISAPIDNDTARSKESDTLSVSQEDKKRTTSCPGSPVSGCGSICGIEDGKPLNIRCKRCRRLARQMADKSEHMNVHFSDQVSLQSFQAEDLVLDLPMGKQGIDSLSEKCSEALELTEVEHDIEKLNASLTSAVGASNSGEPAVLLTEVENDKPMCVFYKEGKKEVPFSKKGLENTQPLSTDKSASASAKENTQDSASVMQGYEHESSPVIRCPSEEKYKVETESVQYVRKRHRSCELALENGRISPSSVGGCSGWSSNQI